MSATISIKEVYEPRRKEYEALVETEEQHLQTLRLKASKLEGEIRALRLNSQKKQALQTEALAAKLDTRPLEQDLQAVLEKIKERESELEALQEAQASGNKKSPALKSTLQTLEALRSIGIEKLVQVERVGDCFEGIAVCLGKEVVEAQPGNGFARVSTCLVDCGDGEVIAVPIDEGSPAFDPNQKPAELSWASITTNDRQPKVQPSNSSWNRSHSIEPPNRSAAWIEKSTGRIIVCFDKKGQGARRSWVDDETIENVGESAAQLRTLAQAELEAAGGKLILALEYPDGSFLARVKAKVRDLTVTKPRFKKIGTDRDPRTVWKEVQADWQAFIQAPWSESIDGVAALLKYTLESGERARFWHKAYRMERPTSSI
jgi:hypothetical protein